MITGSTFNWLGSWPDSLDKIEKKDPQTVAKKDTQTIVKKDTQSILKKDTQKFLILPPRQVGKK